MLTRLLRQIVLTFARNLSFALQGTAPSAFLYPSCFRKFQALTETITRAMTASASSCG